MARFSLYLVVGLIGGALLVSAIARDPGYILLTWGDWQVETSVWFALAGLVAASIAVVTLWRILSSTLRLPGELRRWLGLRSARGAQRRADRGFTAFFEGRWETAEKTLRKASAAEHTLLHPLYAALAALHRGQYERALALLDEAEAGASAPSSMIAMVRAECHVAHGAIEQTEQALDTLSGAERTAPRVGALRAKLAYLQGDWPRLIEHLPELRRDQMIPEEQLNGWEREAWLHVLQGQCDVAKTGAATWRQTPESLKSDQHPHWQALVEGLIAKADWESLAKLLPERFERYCESVSLSAVAALPERQRLKMKKPLQKWRDEDSDGQCHATLARIAESEGDTQAAATLWEKAYELNPSSHTALAWSTWLREQGEEQRAAELEAEALAQIRQGSDSGA